jgi:hypothetical protein
MYAVAYAVVHVRRGVIGCCEIVDTIEEATELFNERKEDFDWQDDHLAIYERNAGGNTDLYTEAGEEDDPDYEEDES